MSVDRYDRLECSECAFTLRGVSGNAPKKLSMVRKIHLSNHLTSEDPSISGNGALESFQNHVLMYAAKRMGYTPFVYKTRTLLAAIDYNKHNQRHVTDAIEWQLATAYISLQCLHVHQWARAPSGSGCRGSSISDMTSNIMPGDLFRIFSKIVSFWPGSRQSSFSFKKKSTTIYITSLG
ncbi:unnamed protein product [Arctogadus glacialis]